MAVTVKAVRKAFGLLYESILDRNFRKTLDLNKWSESELLPLVRTFLLGYFKHCYPEEWVRLPSAPSKWGRIDFQIGDVAVEFAVRRPRDRKGPLSAKVNQTEMIKLLMYDGPALLVLFDFSQHPFEETDIERFRDYPSLGRGNFKRSAFNVAYFHIKSARPLTCGCISKNVRIAKRSKR
ncbi:hypothetical protein [Sphingomonas faeni]|jgi:hypothetical protein|uniref:hypothetical protein n=1 Tax=Sphingomonas faeni TaxID=185950 RepID=UPI003359DCCB